MLSRQSAVTPIGMSGLSVSDRFANVAYFRLERKQFAAALLLFAAALRRDPGHPESHYNLGNLYYDQRQYTLARFHYECVVGAWPEFDAGWFNLALTYYHLGDLSHAEHALGMYEEKCPDDPDLGQLRAVLIKRKS